MKGGSHITEVGEEGRLGEEGRECRVGKVGARDLSPTPRGTYRKEPGILDLRDPTNLPKINKNKRKKLVLQCDQEEHEGEEKGRGSLMTGELSLTGLPTHEYWLSEGREGWSHFRAVFIFNKQCFIQTVHTGDREEISPTCVSEGAV